LISRIRVRDSWCGGTNEERFWRWREMSASRVILNSKINTWGGSVILSS